MDQETINRIAQQYIDTPHTPNHPSYSAFIRETLKQFRVLSIAGWHFTKVTVPYQSTVDLFNDCKRSQLAIYTGGDLVSDNPMGRFSGFIADSGESLTMNDCFRAVHDVIGHYWNNTGFETFGDELAAYHAHSRAYGELAQGALRGETLGQLCYFYAGNGFVELQESKVMEL